MEQEVTTFICPECGSDSVYIQPILTLLDPPYWTCTCCRMGCRHTDTIDKFIIRKIKRTVVDNTSSIIN